MSKKKTKNCKTWYLWSTWAIPIGHYAMFNLLKQRQLHELALKSRPQGKPLHHFIQFEPTPKTPSNKNRLYSLERDQYDNVLDTYKENIYLPNAFRQIKSNSCTWATKCHIFDRPIIIILSSTQFPDCIIKIALMGNLYCHHDAHTKMLMSYCLSHVWLRLLLFCFFFFNHSRLHGKIGLFNYNYIMFTQQCLHEPTRST